MTEHMSYLDVSVLNSTGWEPGFSGDSWFKVDSHGNSWQVYESDHSPLLTFVGPDRASTTMARAQFDELFSS